MNKRYHLDKHYFDVPIYLDGIHIYQAGRLYCKSGTVIDTHTHKNWFELSVITSGKGKMLTNGQEFPVQQNDIYVSFPTDIHGIVSDEKELLEYDFFAFSVTKPEFLPKLDMLVMTHSSADARIIRDSNITAAVQNITRELNNNDEFSRDMLQHLCEQVIVYMIRCFQPIGSPKESSSITNAEALCFEMMSYIDSHIFSLRLLTEIAEKFNYNYSYLSDLFKKTTGQSLTDYHRSRRLDVAARLIMEDKLTITTISEKLGYATVYAFSRAFKAKYGLSPNLYRKQALQRLPHAYEHKKEKS